MLYVPPGWCRYVAALLMLPAFTLALASVFPGYIKARAQYPLLLATLLWAVAHLLTNGSVADLLLFGTFVLWSIAVRVSLARRPARRAIALPTSGANDAIAVSLDSRSTWLSFSGCTPVGLGYRCWSRGAADLHWAATENVHYRSLSETARLLRTKAISPVELTQHMLDRAAAVDRNLKSYVTVMPDRALEASRRAEAEIQSGRYRGPLHGMPIGVKDLCYTRGVATAAGTKVFSGFVPDFDATVVTRLQDAGAVILGKQTLCEGAFGPYHPALEVPVNPWNPASMERRFIERLRRCDRGWPVLRLHRHRHRRVDPVSIRRQRLRRLEADLRTREPAWRFSARRVDGSYRSNGEIRAGRRHPV